MREAGDAERAEPVAIVDGANVAHSTAGAKPRLSNILLVRKKLEEEGYRTIVLVDAGLRHEIDDPASYERLVEEGAIRQAPAGTDADYFLLSFARELDASVVSNDRFRDRQEQFADVTDRVIRFMIVEDEVVLERRARTRRPRPRG
ncbi:MAG: NYN domain-containing protein [Longimicrobiales bacterium]